MDTRAAELGEVPALAGLDGPALDSLAALGTTAALPSGAALYREGDPPDHIYVVLRGRLRVSTGPTLVGYVGRRELVGEMGVVTGAPRTSTVRAVRDSVLLRFSADDFFGFLDAHPSTYRALTRVVLARTRPFRQANGADGPTRGTFAVVPSTETVPVRALAETMVARLSGWPQARLVAAEHVDAALGAGTARAPLGDAAASARIGRWLDELERRHRYLVFAADSGRDPWAARCLHNADRVLVLAEAMAAPTGVPVLDDLRRDGLVAPVELVLLRPVGDRSPQTMAWREVTGARAHYFVHPWDLTELDSLARQVTDRGVTVVLGGGGARGFAHIGLIRALEELEIPVDAVGGTSMGAYVAALVACGYNSMDMTEITRETFVRANYLNDYAVPRVSLIRGRKFAARLRDIFGDRRIEELRHTYFCVCTNLTTGERLVCDRGQLARWLAVSMAVPGVAPPIAYNGELLCDGGVVDNLPTGVMRGLERGAVIACNVSGDGALRAPGAGIGEPDLEALLHRKGGVAAPSLPEILVRTAMLTSTVAAEESIRGSDASLRMPVQDFGMFDWKRLDELVELGHRHAREVLTPLRERLI